MRCPDCNKFTGLETQEPCCDEIDLAFSKDGATEGHFDITANGTTDRNCADCGNLLKQVSWDAETTVELDDLEGFDKLTEKQKKALVEALEEGSAAHEVSEQGTSADESGGGRYKKNIITSTVEFFLEVTFGEIKLTYTGTLASENAASEFEEQC